MRACREFGILYFMNDSCGVLAEVMYTMKCARHDAGRDDDLVVNIAGNRESVAPGIERRTEIIMTDALKRLETRYER